jgi:hypothetical protein
MVARTFCREIHAHPWVRRPSRLQACRFTSRRNPKSFHQQIGPENRQEARSPRSRHVFLLEALPHGLSNFI